MKPSIWVCNKCGFKVPVSKGIDKAHRKHVKICPDAGYRLERAFDKSV
jgi:hypothetical protein